MRKALISNKFMSGATLVVALFVFSSEAMAQSSRELGNRVNRLENEIETLSRALYRGEKPPPSSGAAGDPAMQANTEIRLQEMELQIRQLTGRLEEQSFETRQLKNAFERLSADLDLRLSDLEGGSGSSSNNGASSGSSRGSTPLYNDAGANNGAQRSSGSLGTLRNNSGASADDAAAAYENAFSLLKSGNYDAAELEFDSFVRNHKDHALAGNAKYWLGETFYVRGDFGRAARIFAEGYQQYPDGTKTADNLLKLGLSLSSVGNTKDACIALKQLKKDSSGGSGPVLRRADQEISRLGC